MIIMTLRFTVPPEKIADVIAIINSIKEPLCVEPGCNHFSLYSDINNDNALMLVGEWESQETLKEIIQMGDFSRIFVVLELASQTPEISFDTVSDRVGFELIEQLKG